MKYIILTAITLFFIMDPIGNTPIFISILDKVEEKRRAKVLRRELVIALIVFLIFYFLGHPIVMFLSLKPAAIGIGGGVVLFLIGVKMIFPAPEKSGDENSEYMEPLIVPLAIPLFAGPSALAMILLLESSHPQKFIGTLIAVLIAWFLSAVILLFSNKINKLIGKRGLIATERLMGMLLIMISVQMFLNGISIYLHM